MGAINFFSINGAGSGGGSSAVNTKNGISGDGSVVTPVILGGNPIIQNVDLQVGDNTFNLEAVNSGSNEDNQFTLNKDVAFLASTGIAGQVEIKVVSNAGVPQIQIDYVQSSDGSIKQLLLGDQQAGAFPGIFVIDQVDNVGLTSGGTAFPLNGDQGQYLQAGNAQKQLNAAAQDTAGQTTTQEIPPAYTPLVDSIIRINAYAFYVTGTGSVAVTVDYTDRLGNPQTATLGSINSVTPVTAFPATILKVKGGSPVVVTYTVTGTITYDAGGTIENLFA